MSIRFEQIAGKGVGLNVARAGTASAKPAVVLLHGFPEFWYSWHHQIDALSANGFDVYAPDLRGYNLSDKPPTKEDYHLRLLIEDVACIARQTGKQVHIIGHDWGGIIAWAFAGKYPELVSKLVIMNAPHLKIFRREVLRPPQTFQSWYVLFFQIPWLPERLISADNFALVREVFSGKTSQKDAFSQDDIDKYIAAISQPAALTAALNYYRCLFQAKDGGDLAYEARFDGETLVIWGEKDMALSLNLLNGLNEFAPNLDVHRIPQSGHWVQNEAFAEVNGVLLDFLQK